MATSYWALAQKVHFLRIPPQAWDAIKPHGPIISQAAVEFLAAGVVRDISAQIHDKVVQEHVRSVAKEMATSASAGMAQSWEDGDDLCPPWPPIPFPWPSPWVDVSIFGPLPDPWIDRFGPRPEPWKVASIGQLALADLLASLGEVTANPRISTRLAESAIALAKSVSGTLVKDIEHTLIKPRSVAAK